MRHPPRTPCAHRAEDRLHQISQAMRQRRAGFLGRRQQTFKRRLLLISHVNSKTQADAIRLRPDCKCQHGVA